MKISGNGSLILNGVNNWKKTNEKLANSINNDHHVSDSLRNPVPLDAPLNRPDFVYVYGSVNTESSLIYRSGAKVADYLNQAGMGAAADKNNVILVRADGTALTSSSWFSSILSSAVMPGDAIVVPDKIDLEATWSTVVRNTKDLTQIFYQLGLGAAAIRTLK